MTGNTMDNISGTGTTDSSGTHEFSAGISQVRVA